MRVPVSQQRAKRLQTGAKCPDDGSVVVGHEEDGFHVGCFKRALCIFCLTLYANRTISPLPLLDGIKKRIPACAEVRAVNHH